MDELESWELTDFNIDGHIALSQKFGHLKMMRSDDGKLILAGIASYDVIDQTKPTPTSFFHPDSTLGFVLDIGIRRERLLTRGSGFYFGQEMIPAQSKKKINQSDFDQALFEKIGDLIESHFQSGDPSKEVEAIRIQFLIDEYNNARLMFPNFYAESYLSLMRIVDALADAKGGSEYATFAAQISPLLNQAVYDKLHALAVYADRFTKAEELFRQGLAHAQKEKKPYAATMSGFNHADRLIFSCFYSAYQYRNKFVHKGIPFPDVVKDSWGVQDDAATAYISPSLGQSWSRFNRPQMGLQEGDLIDVHTIVGAEAEVFKETYFLLVPTWHFMRKMTKEAVLNKINSLI